MVRNIVLLGSTGSIGTQTLDVISTRRDQFTVVGLSASGGNLDLLASQILEFQPRVVALAKASAARDLQTALVRQARSYLASLETEPAVVTPISAGRTGRTRSAQ